MAATEGNHATPTQASGDLRETPVQELRREFDHLRNGVRSRLERRIQEQETKSATVKTFAIKSMGTIVGWFTAQVCEAFLMECVGGLTETERGDELLAACIYAGAVTIGVPICFWTLADINHIAQESGQLWKQDQVRLIKGCLPLLVAWAWRDVIIALLAYAQREFWPQFFAAVVLTLFIATCQRTQCFSQAMSKFKAGALESLWGNFKVVPKYFSLSLGFCWNLVAKWPTEQLKKRYEAPLIDFMIQVVYVLIITTFVSFATAAWSHRHAKSSGRQGSGAKVRKQSPQEIAEQQTRHIIELIKVQVLEFGDMTSHVLMDGLHFVYAWAVLDTVNALYFTFLLGCSSPRTCSYQSNFGFALLLTFLFTGMAMMMAVEERFTEWDRAATNLMTNGMALSTGWAWANFCSTSLTEALSVNEVPTKWMWILIFLFAWLCMSVLHYRFSVEERAWRRHALEDLTGHGILESAEAARLLRLAEAGVP